MSRFAYVNGRFVRHGEAAVHIEDRGYQLADGVYEVWAVFDGKLADAQDALAASQRIEVVGRLAAGIAHDFNNILGAVAAFSELAKASVESETVRNDLDEVVHATQRGAFLTRKLHLLAMKMI